MKKRDRNGLILIEHKLYPLVSRDRFCPMPMKQILTLEFRRRVTAKIEVEKNLVDMQACWKSCPLAENCKGAIDTKAWLR